MVLPRLAQLVLVVETNDVKKTDDRYYSWILRNFFEKYVKPDVENNLKIVFHFVHIDGWGNYNKKMTNDQIRSYQRSFCSGPTFVLFCMDHDNRKKETAKRIQAIVEHCTSKGYFLSVAYPEIENVVFPNRGGRNKAEASAYFASHQPKRDSVTQANLFADSKSVLEKPGRTTFGTVVAEIIRALESGVK